ncbi:hypothetical protein Agabi119p4_4914 [Agaricus bisporus var. burnettii]|uniref:Uncharacterized protein n=1 Tax=Agaricus bisporus var. burnettii TaxID=192524 RepID=A0A8H7KHS4_AGABI|nr:hypothetical protein Agabi119p4_4914 [Agaricus bisporus var. burnettii]
MSRSSAPIPASQPGSQVFLNHDNEDDSVDTEPDSDVTPTASEAPISRCESPTITLSATSSPPPANDCAIVEPPTTRVDLVGEQPMAPGSNEPNRLKNPRRGRPPNRGRQSARPGPSGSSTHESVQQGSGLDTTVAAAAPPIRSKLRSRANMGKH